MISDVVANYNLDKTRPGAGIFVSRRNVRRAGQPEIWLGLYEFYGQDAWRIKPNVTVTYGLRWSFFPAPWETNGFQASTSFGLGTQFAQNVKNMNQGIGYLAMPSDQFQPKWSGE